VDQVPTGLPSALEAQYVQERELTAAGMATFSVARNFKPDRPVAASASQRGRGACVSSTFATGGAGHLRQRRLELGLLQRELAERLGADPCTVTNWELNRTSPALGFIPRILALVGFDSLPGGASLGERLKAARRRRGWSQERLAQLVGVDPSTLSRWERNLRIPADQYARRTEAFLQQPAADGAALADPDSAPT
jgi:transcriptional regulator with XRE-family HTH domain